MITDILRVIGFSTLALGIVHEADGIQQKTFWLHNEGTEAVTLTQGYTSCGCTTIEFAKGENLLPGDSTAVVLRFNPRGKVGEFTEIATVAYLPTDSVSVLPASKSRKVQMSLEGECIPSDETLARQYPIVISPNLRLSTSRFDIGVMKVGTSRTRNVSVLHLDDANRKETIPITFSVTPDTPKGLQHIEHVLSTHDTTGKVDFKIILDVIVK